MIVAAMSISSQPGKTLLVLAGRIAYTLMRKASKMTMLSQRFQMYDLRNFRLGTAAESVFCEKII
jgi:hypothetical protein